MQKCLRCSVNTMYKLFTLLHLREESILVICQEKFKIVFDMFFLKKGALHRRSLIIFLKNERYSDSVFNSASSFSPVYSWFLTSKPKTSRTNLRDVSASSLLC